VFGNAFSILRSFIANFKATLTRHVFHGYRSSILLTDKVVVQGKLFSLYIFLRLFTMKFAVIISLLGTVAQILAAVTTNPADAAGKTFDYIVVGAGLTGITVASRLAEDPSISVLLVEAGADNRKDSRVFDLYAYSQAFGSELDWAWPTDQGKVMHG
jgi:hypothetical protein